MKEIIKKIDRYCVAHCGKQTEKEEFIYCTVPYKDLSDFIWDMQELQETYKSLKVIQNRKEKRHEISWREGKKKVMVYVTIAD